jgi:hypothetical protein
MSSLKHAIANAIFSDPEHKPFNFRAIDGQSFGEILSIEFHRTGNLQTQIRVKTRTDGTHYFNLRLSEMI